MDEVEIIDPRFARYLLPNAGLVEIASGFRWIEGPVWIGDWNCLLFQDLPANKTMIWREGAWGDDDTLSIWRAPSHYANGQARDGQGRLICCSHRDRCLYRTELDGRITTLINCYDGRRLNAPNDVAVKRDGTIWFTNPVYGFSNDYEGGLQPSEQAPAVYRLDPASGAITIAA